jgi:EAL domain-containing protein (putative c-di-GMP-specific phosphodiesterase class I)
MEGERIRHAAEEIAGVLKPGAIRVVYQPVFGLATLEIVGYEALARFDREPVRGPDVWFAVAHQAGMGLELELAAIRAAVARFSELPASAYLALNASPATAVSEELATLLLDLPPERLVLEITEHALVLDYDALGAGLERLRARGVRLSIDDAGAGFASLRHILLLAPDIIKLDISLTRGIDVHRGRRSLASALIAFAAEMGIGIEAEGIETAAELEALRGLGAGFGQGYLLGRPGEPPGRNGTPGTVGPAST